MAARKHLAIEISPRQLLSLFVSRWRPMIQKFLLACVLILFTTELSAQETTTAQSTTTETAPVDPAVVPEQKPTPKNVATASALTAGGLSAGAGGTGLPGVEGRVPDMAKVEASGGASFSIPIIVSPGTAGLQPNLSLVYNSQAGNGLFGVGWSLKGLPTIHRCAQQYEPDNNKGRVGYDINDRYCMDGVRLMRINSDTGNYNAVPSEYRTEVDVGVKIVSAGNAGSGPATFIATTKEGRTLEFGNTSYYADIKAVGRDDIRVWALNKIQDTKNNALTISYVKNAAGHYRPDVISYTSNTGLDAKRFVKFIAAPRTDIYPMYIGGSMVQMEEVITNIRVLQGGTTPETSGLVREYKLTYECTISNCDTVTKRSRLKTISECDKSGNCLPAETPQSVSYTFTYQDGGDNTFAYQ
jgi:hypothetical protein